MTLFRASAAVLLAVSALALGACEKQVEAPTDAGVCWHVVVQQDNSLKFNKLATGQLRIENCAIELERMRLRFIGLGSRNREVMGAYQGNYIWVAPQGVFVSQSLKGHRYPSLFRGEDGRLVIPGSEPATKQ